MHFTHINQIQIQIKQKKKKTKQYKVFMHINGNHHKIFSKRNIYN